MVSAGPMDFWGDQTHVRQNEENTNMDENMHALKIKVQNSELEISKALRRAKGVIEIMKSALERQRNVSIDIKNGVEELEENLDLIHSEQEILRKGQEALAGLLWTQVGSKRLETPKTTGPSNKRLASSPTENQAATPIGKKKKRDELTPAQWTIVAGKKEKKQEPNKMSILLPKGGMAKTVDRIQMNSYQKRNAQTRLAERSDQKQY